MIENTTSPLMNMMESYTSSFGTFGIMIISGMILLCGLFLRGIGFNKIVICMTLFMTVLQFTGIINIGNWIWLLWGFLGIVLGINLITHIAENMPRPDTTKHKNFLIYVSMLLGIVKVKKQERD